MVIIIYEILECLDVEQFNQDMQALLRGERVELPYYNFKKENGNTREIF